MKNKTRIILICSLAAVLVVGGVVGTILLRNSDKTENITPVAKEETEEDKKTKEPEEKEEETPVTTPEESEWAQSTDWRNQEEDFFAEYESEEGGSGAMSGQTNSNYDLSTLKGMLASADTLYATTTPLVTLSYPSGMQTVQGGCVYGKYYYQAFIKTDNSGSVIVKYDLDQGTIVKTSGVLELHHTNDLTYNSRLGKLVVCHNAPDRTKVSYVNPDTLTIDSTFSIKDSIFSINYNAATNRYVIGIAGGQTFKIVDANFNTVSSVFQPTDRTTGFTTQGNSSDDNYIYFVLWKRNVIAVYDWNGKFVTIVNLDLGDSIEPESVSIVNDKIYISCRQNGKAVLYRVDGLRQ